MKPIPLSRVNEILLFFILFGVVLYFGKQILLMVIFSGFLAMLMAPLSNKLEGWGVGRILSTVLSILVILIIISLVLMLITVQIVTLTEDIPGIQKRLEEIISTFSGWIDRTFGMSPQEQIKAFKEQTKNTVSSAGSYLTGIATGLVTLIGSFTLVLVFAFSFFTSSREIRKLFCSSLQG